MPTSSWNCFPDLGTGTVCPRASGSGRRKIEQTDPDQTFKVGLIYGPRCGKSSLVKAGLLPRLAKHVLPVYIEATPEETEARLLKGLRKACPDLPPRTGAGRFPGERCGRDACCAPGRRCCWSSTSSSNGSTPSGGEENTELVAALRQCDGEHVQAIVMVRDDFWMAATRFMGDLEIDLLQGQNIAAVDLFDPRHARKVLTAFGTAYGKLARARRRSHQGPARLSGSSRSPGLPRTARSSRCGSRCSPR